MDVDIIDLNDEAYADLTNVQLAMVYSAQANKNSVLAQAESDKKKLLKKLLTQNVARSSMRRDYEKSVDEQAQREVDVIREDLLYRLAYESQYSDSNEFGPYRYPENPNYSLNYAQRFLVVRDYYMHLTNDAQARLQAYGIDSLAVEYLGDYYQTLYDLLSSYIS